MALLLLLAAAAGGLSLALIESDDTPAPTRLAEGVLVGLTALALVGFFAALLFQIAGGTAVACAVVALPALALRRRLRQKSSAFVAALRTARLGAVALALIGGLALGIVMRQAVVERDDSIGTGVAHNLGDLPFHIAIVQSFALGANLPPEHPELAGQALTYPFLVDFLAAQFVVAGASLVRVLQAQSVGLALLTLVLLHRWALDLTGDRLAAVLTPALVLLSGGLGFRDLFVELGTAPDGALAHLARLPHDYTIGQEGFRFGNAVTTLLIPQRAFLLGLPLALVVWRRWWLALEAPDEPTARRRMLCAGLVAGLLPLAHAHAFAVMLAAAAALSVLFPRKTWAMFFAGALALGLPQAAWLASRSTLAADRFVAWQPGWDNAGRAFVPFWLDNAGLFLPALVVALVWRRDRPTVPSRLLRFWLPFAGCFIVPNLLRLSPWIWDNIKYLLFWLVASAPLVALLLARVARRGTGGALASAGLFAVLTLSGGLDVWRAASGQSFHHIFDREGRELGHVVAERTPAAARILTAPAYDHPVFLSGRRVHLGYEGHIWSQGLTAAGRRDTAAAIYAGTSAAPGLIEQHGIDYIARGPHEERTFAVNEGYFAGLELVAESGPYRLYASGRGSR